MLFIFFSFLWLLLWLGLFIFLFCYNFCLLCSRFFAKYNRGCLCVQKEERCDEKKKEKERRNGKIEREERMEERKTLSPAWQIGTFFCWDFIIRFSPIFLLSNDLLLKGDCARLAEIIIQHIQGCFRQKGITKTKEKKFKKEKKKEMRRRRRRRRRRKRKKKKEMRRRRRRRRKRKKNMRNIKKKVHNINKIMHEQNVRWIYLNNLDDLVPLDARCHRPLSNRISKDFSFSLFLLLLLLLLSLLLCLSLHIYIYIYICFLVHAKKNGWGEILNFFTNWFAFVQSTLELRN